MAYKFLIVFAFIAATNALRWSDHALKAAPLAAAPVVAAPVVAKAVEVEEYDPHPQYQYGYDIQDSLSGDSKGHVEERDGDVVRGEYSLIDADGLRRTVTYTADPINGFNAVVRREPVVVAAPAPIVRAAPVVAAPAPVVRAAPLVAAPAPIARAAPLAYAAPAPLLRSAPLLRAAPAPLAVAPPAIVRSAPLLAAGPAPLTYATPTFAFRNF